MRNANNRENGFIMALVLVILTILTVFGVAMMLLSNVNLETVGNMRIDQKSLNIAYSLIERGKTYIAENSCTLNEIGGAELLDSDASGFVYIGDNIATATEVKCIDVIESTDPGIKAQYGVLNSGGKASLTIQGFFRGPGLVTEPVNQNIKEDYFLLTAVGEEAGGIKTVQMRYKRKSYLDFALFNSNPADVVTLPANETVKGSVYVAGTLTATENNTILGDLYYTDVAPADWGDPSGSTNDYANLKIGNASFLEYERDLSPGSAAIDVPTQVADFFTQATPYGWVIDPAQLDTWADPATSVRTVLDLGALSIDSATSMLMYDGPSTISIRAKDQFNRMIFWEETTDLYIKGEYDLDESVTIFARNSNIVFIDGIHTGGKGFVGVVVSGAGKDIIFSQYAPVYVYNQAALMVVDGTIVRQPATGGDDFAAALPWWGSSPLNFDLNRDAVFDNPTDSWGWEEVNITVPGRVNLFVQDGPVIVSQQMQLGLWEIEADPTKARIEKAFLYNPEIMNNQPPFPVIPTILERMSYGESEDPL